MYSRSDSRIIAKLAQVKLLALDCDGVLTDNYIYVDNAGNESSRFSHYDGHGIRALRESGVMVVVISGQISPYVKRRCEKMGLPCIQEVSDKLETLGELLCAEQIFQMPPLIKNVSPREVCFVGDDTNDIGIMSYVGVPIAVANAMPEVKKIAAYVTEKNGGEGAVREVCDLIIEAKKDRR